MRKVTYGGAISLDGYLAGPDEAIDWLRWTEDSAKISAESFRGVDTMLMGRKTFDFAQRMGGGPKIKGVTTYVFSRTLKAMPDGADGELISSFDNHYGDSIRTSLRDLEELCGSLRAFSFPSKALEELKDELPGVQAEIEEKAFSLSNLLAEVDHANSAPCRDWCSTFEKEIEAANLKLESASADAVKKELELRKRVEKALDLYRDAIRHARSRLEQIRKKV